MTVQRLRVFRGCGIFFTIAGYFTPWPVLPLFVFGILLVFEWEFHTRAVNEQIEGLVAQLASHRQAVSGHIDGLIGQLASHRQAVDGQVQALVARFADLEKRAGEALQFAYLADPDDIWKTARQILKELETFDEIWSTASSPNKPVFEEEVFRGAVSKRFIYKRLLCYTKDHVGVKRGVSFTPFDDAAPGESVLDLYCAWYARFFKEWEAALDQDPSGSISSQAMKTWEDALRKLQPRISNVFKLKSFGSEVASDYFILRPHRDHHQAKAVVGFPMMKGEGMRGGLSITLPILAKELLLNLHRLWPSEPLRPEQTHDESSVHSGS